MFEVLLVLSLSFQSQAPSDKSETRAEASRAREEQGSLDASQVLEAIAREGPKAVLHRLSHDVELWESVTDRMAEGKDEWIDVAVELNPASDAASAFDLSVAMGEALSHNPERVLREADRFTMHLVCGWFPMDKTGRERLDILERRARLVIKVRRETPSLAQLADACLVEIDDAKKRAVEKTR